VSLVKLVGVALLCIASVAVLLGVVGPIALSLIAGLGIQVPQFWARSGRVFLVASYPWVVLVAGVLLLVVFGWGIWRLMST